MLALHPSFTAVRLTLLLCKWLSLFFPVPEPSKLLLLLLKQSTTLCCVFSLYMNDQCPLCPLRITGIQSCFLLQKLSSLDLLFLLLLSVVDTSFQFRQVNFKAGEALVGSMGIIVEMAAAEPASDSRVLELKRTLLRLNVYMC